MTNIKTMVIKYDDLKICQIKMVGKEGMYVMTHQIAAGPPAKSPRNMADLD